MRTTVTLTTATAPGAIALLQLHGDGAGQLLRELAGVADWPGHLLRRCDFAGIDSGLAYLRNEAWAQLMPHGGPRVVRELIDAICERGATYQSQPDSQSLYPEAASAVEADVLATIARAASPAAIDLLAAQPDLWRRAIRVRGRAPWVDVLACSEVLDRLLDPPMVVVVGQPNVGKSTLSNHVLGRAASLVADLPGTTRDWVGGLAELGSGPTTVAVRWLDTPGLRGTADAPERQAILLSSPLAKQAQVLIAMRDSEQDWPDPEDLGRRPDLHVFNKVDLCPEVPDDALAISAHQGIGIDVLVRHILELLGLVDLYRPVLWAFSPTLRKAMSDPSIDLQHYLGKG